MTVAESVILALGFLALLAGLVVAMRWAMRSEAQRMERKRQEWIDAGSKPEEEPNFYLGFWGG